LTRKKALSYLASIASTRPTIFGGVLGNLLDYVIPSSWFAFEKVNYCHSFDILFDGTFDPVAQTISPLRLESNRKSFNRDAYVAGETPRRIILYSIGWDQKDDGGTLGPLLLGHEGDWVWESADHRPPDSL
jgi:hypothetical protein